MRLLLINKNPVVARMMLMSVPKAGFEIEEVDSVHNLPRGEYDVVVIDDEMYDENFLHDIKQNIQFYQLGLIASSKDTHSDQFDFILSKPFLPTDLIEILRDVKNKIQLRKKQKGEAQKPLQPLEPTPQPVPPKEEVKEERESIVEVEEQKEESPFIQEKLEKGGVLDEKDVQKVNSLLQEEEKPIELKKFEEQPLKIDEEFFKEKIEPVVSLSAPKSKPKTAKKEPLKIDNIDPLLNDPLEERELDIEEAKSQSLLEDIADLKEETPKEVVCESNTTELEEFDTSSEITTSSKPKISIKPSLEELLTKEDKEEAPPLSNPFEGVEESSPQPKIQPKKIEQELNLEELKPSITTEPLGVEDLRKLLDGMQLDITIRISFPGKK